ncbi:DMSO/TMAO reductase YedYZ molybdopterin-dependent catalytic subunit [Sphingobium sp. OAS761]|uniref:molybdopterin-binding protein n=1 Tax=Sphingobium sp. OAS761 TaxID=2817901 RepID=UPI00209FD5DC|nr:molybdopterin-binding protein [Sphingobium sp. OAS761]MCP1469000.1 DMSO/TMAO reductase YedYZ molybdopterin-dependent catalytic subunit [Sphingobium sp. OAS761]
MILNRRTLLLGATATLAGCDRIARNETFRNTLFSAENFHKWAQRSLMARDALAQEFRPDQISPVFRANGTANPNTEAYKAIWRTGFADWRLEISGLVERPLALSLAQLRAFPQREQITRHDCVEGWSAIGKWRGVPLKTVLEAARLRDSARYIVFRCADDMGGGNGYYESIDRVDAFHPQTILAHMLNDRPLSVANGAPLRLRVERHLGYKQAKYLMRIDAVDTLSGIGRGKGGFWEDHANYDWYAGI